MASTVVLLRRTVVGVVRTDRVGWFRRLQRFGVWNEWEDAGIARRKLDNFSQKGPGAGGWRFAPPLIPRAESPFLFRLAFSMA